jgi:zinc transporter, ZIP family
MTDAASLGIAASLLAGAMTGIGGLLVAVGGPPDTRRQHLLMGFAAGVMIAAAFFSLIIPGIRYAQMGGMSPIAAAFGMIGSVALGAMVLAQLGRMMDAITRRRFVLAGMAGQPVDTHRHRVLLLVIAITLHNVPEGMAVGLSFMSDDPQLGWATAVAIGIQNVPEGMAVAAVLATLGWSMKRCALGALATGLVEPLGGVLGVAIVQLSTAALPWMLGLSAGAMLFVVVAELIPAISRRIEQGSATPALMAGLAFMMVLDVSLGG